MKPKSSIARNPDGTYVLAFHGEFLHPHWVAFLFSKLARQQISVMSGRATCQGLALWDASFQLDFKRSAAAPEHLNYLAMTEEEELPASAAPQLSSYQIVRRPDESLEIWVQGPDQIGFLSRLLGRLSMLGLFPREMLIDTVGGRIQDVLVFRAIGGAAPNESTRQRLDAVLRGWVKTD